MHPPKDSNTAKPKPWRVEVAVLIGLAVGLLIWWGSYDPSLGLFQKPQLIVGPAAFAALLAWFRNKRKKSGPYDPETQARNVKGRY
jgi:hypothetical protein